MKHITFSCFAARGAGETRVLAGRWEKEIMQKWEYLTFLPFSGMIYYSETKVDSLMSTINRAFPKAKLKLANSYVIEIKNVNFMDLADFLGNEGWELVSGYRHLSDKPHWLFKRPQP